MLVFLSNGMAAIFVYPTNLPGIELDCHANVFFCFGGKKKITDQVSEDNLRGNDK